MLALFFAACLWGSFSYPPTIARTCENWLKNKIELRIIVSIDKNDEISAVIKIARNIMSSQYTLISLKTVYNRHKLWIGPPEAVFELRSPPSLDRILYPGNNSAIQSNPGLYERELSAGRVTKVRPWRPGRASSAQISRTVHVCRYANWWKSYLIDIPSMNLISSL